MKLTVVLNGRTLKRHEFSEESRLVKIGRSDDCEVPIDNLGISRVHCEVARRGRGLYMVRDLKSGNGTFVNGSRVESHNLNHGDTISVGKFTIRFECETEQAPAKKEPENVEAEGGVPKFGMMTMQMDPNALLKKHRQQQARNLGFFSRKGDKDIVLKATVCTFGTDRDANVKLSGWFCPRVVAIVIRDESAFRIIDVTNKGGAVMVNGITKRDATLSDNDAVRVRGMDMVFHRGLPVGGG